VQARVDRIEAEVARLAHALDRVEARLAAIETAIGGVEPAPAAPATVRPATVMPATGRPAETVLTVAAEEAPPALGRDVTLAGRALLALGGGFLLRALTDAAVVPGAIGLAAGLVYALVWLALADRAARLGLTHSAIAHGTTGALLGFPLAWEAAVRFQILPAFAAVVLAGALASVLLLVSRRRSLPALGVIAVAAAASCSLAIAIGTRQPGVAAFLLALLAPGVAVLSRRSGRVLAPWLGLGALAIALSIADLGVFVERAALAPRAALAIQVLVTVTALGATELLLRRSSPVRWAAFQWTQAAVALTLGYGGALVVAHALLPRALPWLGAVSLALAALLYVRHLAPERRPGAPAALPDTHAWRLASSVALALLAGGAGGLAPSHAALSWSLAAGALAVLGATTGSRTALLHAALLVPLAAGAGGLASSVARAFVGPSAAGAPTTATIAPLVAAVLCLGIPLSSDARARASWPPWSEATGRAVLLAIALLGAGATLLGVTAAAVPLDAGALAAARTGTLVLIAVAAAALSRAERLRAAAWLVYPLFAATAIKIVLEDVPHGRPVTLFASLALFGVALLVAPRLARQRTGSVTPVDPPAG
jgi:hypothetical protein